MSPDYDKKDYDKKRWQEEQAARDAALERQREKQAKARERSARNARRKIERLHRTLTDKGEISDFENEFGESIVERLDKFGSAFHDREKGRPGDALSFAQKRVVAAMNKKVKELKKKPLSSDDPDADYERTADRWKNKPKSSFKTKGFKSRNGFTPRVRHLEDDMIDDKKRPPQMEQPFMPEYVPPPKKPFLRLVKTNRDG